jgi:hypothetical protein
MPSSDRRAFQLGYALEYTAQTGADYVNRVARLKDAPEEQETRLEAQLSEDSETVRQRERNGVLKALSSVRALGGAPSVETWLSQRAGALALPPKPAEEASENDSADVKRVLATVDEISDFTAQTRDQLPGLVTAVKLHAGGSGLWSFKAGQMMADVGSSLTDAHAPSTGRVRELLDTAPAGLDEDLKQKLCDLLPGATPGKQSPGAGNLSSLVPDAPARADAAVEARNAFLQKYGLTDLPETLEKS